MLCLTSCLSIAASEFSLPVRVLCRNSLQHFLFCNYRFRFILPFILQIVEMDNILKDSGDQTLGQEFFQDVALHFRL